MATARKLPSGGYRCLVFAGYTYKDGKKKRRYESFTAPTKREAERLAYAWNGEQRTANITVYEAIERYIAAKKNVLSPSTIRGYKQMQDSHYEMISAIKVTKLNTEDVQALISALSSKVGPKTVKNAYGLLISAVRMFRPGATFHVSLPKAVKKARPAPTNGDVQKLFKSAEGDMRICIALAAFGSMRRGEICALQYKDISGNELSVHADMVETDENKFVRKEMPKTAESVRTVTVPSQVIALIGKGADGEYIIKRTPNAVTHAFTRLRDKVGINIRLHDLRHYYAAVGAILGVPDNYLSAFGGWKAGSSVMKEVYQGLMVDASSEYADLMAAHFAGLMSDKVIPMQHDMQHEKRKVP